MKSEASICSKKPFSFNLKIRKDKKVDFVRILNFCGPKTAAIEAVFSDFNILLYLSAHLLLFLALISVPRELA